MNLFSHRSLFLLALHALALAACGSSSMTDSTGTDSAAIGTACAVDAPCRSGLVCGSSGIALALCTVSCHPESADCPAGTFCSNLDDTGAAAACLPLCSSDSDCSAGVASCNDAYLPDGGSGPQVCGVQ